MANSTTSTLTINTTFQNSGTDIIGEASARCVYPISSVISGPAWSLGNTIPGVSPGGWSESTIWNAEHDSHSRGINTSLSFSHQSYAIGDKAGIYGYLNFVGGPTAPSDEGACGINIQARELSRYLKGLVGATSGVGDLTPTIGNLDPSGLGNTIDGAILLNTSKGTISGHLTGPSLDVTGYLKALPVDVSLPLTNAWCYLPTGGSTSWGAKLTNGSVIVQVTDETFPIGIGVGQIVSGLGLNPGTLISEIDGNFLTLSQAAVSTTTATLTSNIALAIGNHPTTTYYSITLRVTLNEIEGSTKPFQVGVVRLAGSSFSETGYLSNVEPPVSGVQQVTLHYRYPNAAAYLFQGGIANQYISFDANLALSAMRSSYMAVGSLTGTDLIYVVNLVGGTGFTLPIEGSEAASSTPLGIIQERNGFHLYPGAEVIANLSDGYSPLLEQNDVPWAVGDTIENPLPGIVGGHGAWFIKEQHSPSHPSYGTVGASIFFGGEGFASGAPVLEIATDVNPMNFKAYGGPLDPGYGIKFTNAESLGIFLECDDVPMPTGAVIALGNPKANIDQPISVVGAIAAGTYVMTIDNLPAGIGSYAHISGPGLPTGTRITLVDQNNLQLVLSQSATETSTAADFTVRGGGFYLITTPKGKGIYYDGSGYVVIDNLSSEFFAAGASATAVTQSAGDNSTRIATTSYVDSAVANGPGSNPEPSYDGVSVRHAVVLGPNSDNDARLLLYPNNYPGSQQGNFLQLIGDGGGGIRVESIGTPVNVESVANGASPATGWNFVTAPTVPTQSPRDNSLFAASTAYVDAAIAGFTGSTELNTPNGVKTMTITNGLITSLV